MDANNTVEILQLNGRFDAFESPAVAVALDELIKAGSSRIVINLGSVGFIDSTALTTLVQAMKRSRQHQGDCKLCALQPQVQIIFELTRLDKAFDIFKDEYSAIQAFSAEPAAQTVPASSAAGHMRWGGRAP